MATLIALGTAMLSPYVGTLFNCDSLKSQYSDQPNLYFFNQPLRHDVRQAGWGNLLRQRNTPLP